MEIRLLFIFFHPSRKVGRRSFWLPVPIAGLCILKNVLARSGLSLIWVAYKRKNSDKKKIYIKRKKGEVSSSLCGTDVTGR